MTAGQLENSLGSSISLDSGLTLEMGDHTYIHDNQIRNPSGALTHVKIGKFCSIATELTVIGYDHHTEWISTYPFLDDGNRNRWPGTGDIPYPQAPEFGSNKSRGDITIGNDVWIGYNVKLFKGVTIGDGAVIGACSLVNKSVEPYTIVAGSPTRVLRRRFSDQEIAVLEKLQWWSWPEARINKYMHYLCSGDVSNLEKMVEQEQDFDEAQVSAEPDFTRSGTTIVNFTGVSRDVLKEVEPPALTSDHLKNSQLLPTRTHILDYIPKGGVCAEIGTQTGRFAKKILSILQPSRLHIYDLNFTAFDHAHFKTALEQGIVELHQGDSSQLLAEQPDQTFDYIYIDGDHSYAGAVRDLEQAALKIKDSGWIVCNDYTVYSPLEKAEYGVNRAVNEFCLQRGYEIVYFGLHPWGYHDVALRKLAPKGAAKLNGTQNGTRLGLRPVVAKEPPVIKNGASSHVTAVALIREIGKGDEMFTGDSDHYFRVGESALHCINSALTAAAKPRHEILNILDMPCGHGRVMRHLNATFPAAKLTACDLNRGAVDFCGKTFGAEAIYSNVDVNLIPVQGKFDLIWCGSLLTHLRAEPCAKFVEWFGSRLNPGGLLIFTLHGRWVERSLATGRYKYGLPDPAVAVLLAEYYRDGFGYADYPGQSGYGISVSSPAYVLDRLVGLPDLKLTTYHEKGWDNHQDVVCLQKQTAAEPLG